jgi:lysophospholipase L1-like esterase
MPVLFGRTGYQAQILRTGPLAYWPLNETSGTVAKNLGSLGAAANGTYSGPVLAQAAAPGGGLAPRFDGTNKYVNVKTAALDAAFSGAGSIGHVGSVSVWAKSTGFTDGLQNYLLSFVVDGNNWIALHDPGSANNRFTMTKSNLGSRDECFRTDAFHTDWFNATMTWDNNNDRIRYYRDGALLETDVVLGTFTAGALLTGTIGYSSVSWVGNIAHVALWNRELTEAEIQNTIVQNYHSTLVTYGDSITAGVGASDAAHRWANIVAATKGYFLQNSGVSSTVLQNTVQNAVATIGAAADGNGRDTYTTRINAHNPKYVIFLYGLNDLRLNDAAFSVANFQNDLGEIIDGIVEAGTLAQNIVVGSPPYMNPAMYGGSAPWNAGSTEKHEAHAAACAAVASAKGTRYADIYTAMLNGGGNALLTADGIHPNDSGHALIAATFLGVL